MTQPESYRQRLQQSLGILPIVERMAEEIIVLLDENIGKGATRGVVYHACYEVPSLIRHLSEGPVLDMALTEINAALSYRLPPTDNWTLTLFTDYTAGDPIVTITTVVDVVGHTVVSEKLPPMDAFLAKGFVVKSATNWVSAASE